jgi:hypothetical protein
VAWAVFDSAAFEVTGEEPRSFESSKGVIRTFCQSCGTSLTYQNRHNQLTIDITTASFDVPDIFGPNFEIWVSHKVCWEVQDLNIPQLLADYD